MLNFTMSKRLKIFIFSIIAVTVLFFLNINNVRAFLGENLPPQVKIKLKELVLGKKYLDYLDRAEYYSKLNYNQKVFPITQFEKLEFKKIKLSNPDVLEQTHYGKVKKIKSNKFPFFLDTYNNDIIIVTVVGNVKIIKDNNFSSIKNINSNLNNLNNVKVFDIKVVDNFLYVSLDISKVEKDCKYFSLYRAKINEENIVFEKFFDPNKCVKDNLGGRISFGKFNNEQGVILTTSATGEEAIQAQNNDSYQGKILFFSEKGTLPKIISKGHRNPQGLYVDGALILSTEHGPYGGDEINKIVPGNNYGWPIASYGDNYNFEIGKQNYTYKKNHLKNGFAEPIYVFVPSIGISEIIKIPNTFSRYWQDNYFVGSLYGGSLFRIKFDKNFDKIVFSEKIALLGRIRDITFIEKINSFALAMEDHGEIWLLKSSN